MLTRYRAAPSVAALVLPGLLFASLVGALETQLADRTSDQSGRYELPSTVWPVPVGHRQPRAADIPANVPKDEFDSRLEQIHRDLDRKLQICRGC